jgi:hypothetical protein
VRAFVATSNCCSIWWRFGDFAFGRSFRLVDALHHVLTLTVAPLGPEGAALVPPTAVQLSNLFTLATNPATGETGAANELPRLLVSAASDVKRFGVSEPATKLLVSLKQFVGDLMAMYDVGWFIDPATGWFRIEHRSYLDGQRVSSSVLDLTAQPGAILPRAYSYRRQQLPRYEELTIASASTDDDRMGLPGGSRPFATKGPASIPARARIALPAPWPA